MPFKLKDLIISLSARPGEKCPTASAPFACPTASAFDPRFCPTASAIDPRFCPTASAGLVLCPTASAPILVMPAANFCPTASAAGFCPTASAGSPGGAAEAAPACPTASAPAQQAGREGLAALKQQLQQALADVEAQEKALAGSELPATLAEAEELEAGLRGALEELLQHKESLKKKG